MEDIEFLSIEEKNALSFKDLAAYIEMQRLMKREIEKIEN